MWSEDKNEVFELKGSDFKTFAKPSPMLAPRYSCRTAVIGSDVYLLGEYV